MRLFIRIQNGVPFEHPIFEDNFRMAFPDIDIDNLPSDFAEFIREEEPEIGLYQVCDGCTYDFIDGYWRDNHHIRDMTQQEKDQYIQDRTNEFLELNPSYVSWAFNEEVGKMTAPVAKPVDDNIYRWNEEALSWVIIEDGE